MHRLLKIFLFKMKKTKQELLDEISELKKQLTSFESSNTKSFPSSLDGFFELKQELFETVTVLEETLKISKTGSTKWDLKTNEIIWTDQTYDIFGVDKKTFSLTKENILNLIHLDDLKNVINWFEANFAGETIEPIIFKSIKPNGALVHIKMDSKIIKNKQKNSLHSIGIIQDITKEINFNLKIKKTSKDFEFLFKNNPIPMWVYDRKSFKFIKVNEAAIQKYGYSREEFLSLTILDIRPKNTIKKVKESIFRFQNNNNNNNNNNNIEEEEEWIHCKKNGEQINVNVTSRLIMYQGFNAAIVTIHDITTEVHQRKRLAESEKKYRMFFEHSYEGIYKSTPDGKFIDVNDAMIDILGYDSKEEILSIDIITQHHISPENWSKVLRNFTDGKKIEYQVKQKDGTIIWVEDLGYTEYDKNGKPLFYRGSIRNITEAKSIEKNLKESAITLSKKMDFANELIDKIPGMFFVFELINNDLKLIQWNTTLEKTTNYSNTELNNKSLLELISEKEHNLIHEKLNEIIENGNAEAEFNLKTKNNSLIPLHFRAKFIIKGSNKIVIGTAIDISQRQKVEKELRQSEEKFRLISSTAQEGIILIDHNGKVTLWNKAAEQIFGYTNEEAIGQVVHKLIASPQHQKNYHKGFKTFKKTGKGPMLNGSIVLDGIKKSGENIMIEISTSAFKIEDQWHSAALIRDISDQENIKIEKANLLEELKNQNTANIAINDALSGFIDNSSPKVFFKKILDSIINISKSQFGFMGRVNYENGNPILITNAITDIGWDDMSKKVMANFKNGENIIFKELHSLYGQTLKTKEVFIENNPFESKLKYSKGLPKGHPELISFMSIPLIHNNELIGMVGFANKAGGYTLNDLEGIQPFLNICNRLVKQSIEDEFRDNLQLETEAIATELRQFIETANAPIFGIDSEGLVNEWNQTAEKITGFKKVDVLGKDLVQTYITEDYRESVKQVLDNALLGKETANYEFPLFTSDNRRVMVLLNSSTRRNADGQITGVLGVGQDISQMDKLRTETEAIATELRQFIETANAPIFGIDSEGLVNEWNQTAEKITGFKKVDVLGKDLVQTYITEDYRESVKQVLDNALLGKETANYEFPLFTSDNRRVMVLLNSSTRRNADGQITGVLGVGQDISQMDKLRTETEAIATELRQFIETANAPIFGIDSEGLVNEWNQTAEKITGFKKEDVLGKDLVQTYITEDYRDSVKQVLDDALLGKETANYEFPLFTKDDQRVMVLLNSSTRRNADGQIIGVLGVGQDITELVGYRNELEVQVNKRTIKLNQALKKEKELNELKSRFVSTASHEFRTPLSAINFAAGSIKKYFVRMEPEMIEKKLEKIEDQVHHMTKLLDDVLIVGQADAGKIRNNPTELSLGAFMEGIIEEVYSSSNKSHEIELIDPKNIGTATIFIDEKLGRNIFINLISNAVKFSPEANKVNIELTSEKKHTVISITDFGIGIPRAELKNIFKPFSRGKNVDLIQGTGLGLSIVKEAVEEIGGEIIVNSEIGNGTTFIIKIPKK